MPYSKGKNGDYTRSVHATVADQAAAALRHAFPADHVMDLLATSLEHGLHGQAHYDTGKELPLYEPIRDLDRFDDLGISAIALGRRNELEWKAKVGEPATTTDLDLARAEAVARARGITIGDRQEHAIRVAAHKCRGCGMLEDCAILRPDCPVGGAPSCTQNCSVCKAWIAALKKVRA